MSSIEFPPHPESRLASLLDSLITGETMSEDVRHWLIKAFVHYLRHGGAEPLDRFLGLAPINAGERSLSTRLALLKRDLHLVQSLDKIALDTTVSDWERCLRLEREIPSFEAHAWKLHKHCVFPPASWPEWKKELFCAFQSSSRMPRTARRLNDILKQVREVSLPSPGIKLLTSLTRIQRHEKDLVHVQRTDG